MGVHLYCITPAGRSPDADRRGVGNVTIRAVPAHTFALWLSTHDERPQPDIAALRAHNAVIQAAMDHEVTPVPIRFGQWFATESAAVEQVAAQAEMWQSHLRRVAGRAEYGVRVLLDESASPARDVHPEPAASGRAYMSALARRHAHAERLRADAERLAAVLAEGAGELTAESRVETRPDEKTLINIAHLVAWRDVEAYHTHVRDIAAAHPALRFLFTGPWPPYSFVS